MLTGQAAVVAGGVEGAVRGVAVLILRLPLLLLAARSLLPFSAPAVIVVVVAAVAVVVVALYVLLSCHLLHLEQVTNNMRVRSSCCSRCSSYLIYYSSCMLVVLEAMGLSGVGEGADHS